MRSAARLEQNTQEASPCAAGTSSGKRVGDEFLFAYRVQGI